MLRLKVSCTRSGSSNRSRPLLTKMQVSWSPIALWSSMAVTAESTPPERAQITRPSPTCSWMRLIESLTKFPGVQDSRQSQVRTRKFSNIDWPKGV